MNTYPIASDLSFECLQKRLRTRQLEAPELNDQNRRLFSLPSHIVVREAFISDRESVSDSFQGEGLGFDLTLGHYRGPARRKA